MLTVPGTGIAPGGLNERRVLGLGFRVFGKVAFWNSLMSSANQSALLQRTTLHVGLET